VARLDGVVAVVVVTELVERVLLVLERGLVLRVRERLQAVLEEPARHGRTELALDLALVVRANDEGLEGLVGDELPALVLVDGLVDLLELAAGEADDAPRLVAVQDDLAVLLLKRDADALGDEVHEDRAED